MSTQLTNDELGAIAAVMGNKEVPAEWQAGYDAKKAEMAAERAAHEAKMAEYNRLAAEGRTDAEIEQLMQ